MIKILGFRTDEQGGVTVDWIDGTDTNQDFEEYRSTYISPQAQAKYEYIGKIISSILDDSVEILDLIHRYKSGNMVV